MKKITAIFLLTTISSSYVFSQAVGIGTSTPNPLTVLHVDAANSTTKGVLFSGLYDESSTVPNLGIGSRLMFFPGKAAFRAGAITNANSSEYWNDINVGQASIAMGANNIASGFASAAFGVGAKAYGAYSMAIGVSSLATGNSAIAFGGSDATGDGAYSFGGGNLASGRRAVAFGTTNVAKGFSSTVIGVYNDSILTSDQSSVETTTPLFIVGNGNSSINRSNAMVVLKNGSVGIGTNAPDASTLLEVNSGTSYKGLLVSGATNLNATVPNLGGGSRMMFYPGKSAFRAGRVFNDEWNNANVGSSSVAMGYGTIASNYYSFAVGDRAKATGEASAALGWLTEATAFATTAIGASNKATGQISTVTGYANIARGFASTVIGYFNDPIVAVDQTDITSTTPLFIIGNGNTSGARANAMVVLKNGNVGIGSNAPSANLVLNDASSTTLQLQAAGIEKGFVQLSGDNLRLGTYAANATGNVTFRLNGSDRFIILPNGNATLTGTLTQNSDERFKQDIKPIDDALDKVKQLNGYEYHWKPELQRDSALQIGLLAQNVEKVLPQLVATDKEGTKSVAYQNMIPVLIEAIKKQQQQIQLLEAKMKGMEKQ